MQKNTASITDKKICLIYTGGTIGMHRDVNGVLRPPENPEDFLHLAPELDTSEFDFVPLLNKDSTNMIPADWTAIAEAIYERRKEGYIGFVVAHGTDTMHFSASAVALALGSNLNFPVVFTGAQTAQRPMTAAPKCPRPHRTAGFEFQSRCWVSRQACQFL